MKNNELVLKNGTVLEVAKNYGSQKKLGKDPVEKLKGYSVFDWVSLVKKWKN